MIDFPQELIVAVFVHINQSEERAKTLKACSLISHTWCSLAQPLLFSIIRIDRNALTPTKNRGVISSRIITESPHILKWIDQLIISTTLETPNSLLLDIIRATTSLRSLYLTESVAIEGNMNLDPELLLTLPNTLSSTRLTKICLTSIGQFPVQLFEHCIALEHLSLRHCTFCGDQNASIAPRRTEKPRLKSFLLVVAWFERSELNIWEWLVSPQSPFDLSQLQALYAADRRDTYIDVCQFTSRVASTLSHLLLSLIIVPKEDTVSAFPVTKLRNLRICEVAITPRIDKLDIEWALHFLSNLPQPQLLTRFVIHYGSWATSPAARDLEPFAAQLSTTTFNHVQVEIILYRSISQEELENMFSHFLAQGRLMIMYSVVPWYDEAFPGFLSGS